MINLNNAATTPMLPEVLEAVRSWSMEYNHANPASSSIRASEAAQAVEEARRRVAKLIDADPSRVFFTSGATESNNTVIADPRIDCILASDTEHSSVVQPTLRRAQNGTEFCTISTDEDGRLDPQCVEKILSEIQPDKNLLVCAMWVNNVTGITNDLYTISAATRRHPTVRLLSDATQALGHVPISVRVSPVDALSASAHKIGGPMGVGLLYLAPGCDPPPLLLGGGQERGIRSGTINLPGVVGFGLAASIASERLAFRHRQWTTCRCAFMERLRACMQHPFFVLDSDFHVPNIISLTIPGIHAESLVVNLDINGVEVSAGSACSTGSTYPDPSLLAAGISTEHALSTIRISMRMDETVKNMTAAASVIADTVRFLYAHERMDDQ